MVLYDMYETRYGIFNHLGSSVKRPLASVALHEAEDLTHTSNLYEAIDTFPLKGIKEAFGLSLKEYLDLPSDLCIRLTEIASKEAITKNNMLANLEAGFKPKK